MEFISSVPIYAIVLSLLAIIVNIFWSPEFTGIMDKLRKRKAQEINSNKAIQ